ncbi:DNRLRE domain-containing protein [Actinokineospora enzanensis]|uniref:DNRLRE domain-containing protein n=1 Tax=Actinokineospora enzanensis TaxID=155975 RepID=UPI00037AD85A|nr:DNRLRE domain-containing protein [Actinokineospora enzanensis]
MLSRFLLLALVFTVIAVDLPASLPFPRGGDRAAAGAARPGGPPVRVRELTEQRSAATQVFQLSDGRQEVELSARPQYYRAANGEWLDIDTSVRDRPADGYRYANDTNAFTSSFGDDTGRLAGFALGGTRVDMGLAGAHRPAKAIVDGSTVRYPDAIPGAELSYQVTRGALKERITLSAPPKDDPAYRFTLHLDGVTALARPDGSIAFHGKDDGPPLYVLPRPFMTDATTDAKSPHDKVWSDKVTQTVEQHGADVTITVAADPAWLADPARHYPVVIDPTIKIEPNAVTAQDAQIWSDTPDRADGASYQLSVGTDDSGVARSLVKFDTSVVPAGTSLTAAKLRMYYDNELYTNANDVTTEARRITAPWVENSVTWNNANAGFAEAGLGTAVKRANATQSWSEWDVRNLAQSWVSGSAANHGLMVKATDETLRRGGAVYQAAEGDYNGDTESIPKLLLTYGRPGAVLQPITKTYATGAELVWTPYADPNPGDPADDIVEYQVHRSVSQVYTPSAATLITSVGAQATRFVDTTAQATPDNAPDLDWNAYYYSIVVKTRDGQLIPSATQLTRTPKAGQVRQIFRGAADTTLSSAQANTNLDVIGGQPWLQIGNNGATYGKTRALLRFDGLTAIPAGTTIVDADLSVWAFYSNGSGASFDGHTLSRPFVENQATWNRASTATAWTAPGGDIAATRSDFVSGITDRPAWLIWENAAMVQGWVNNPATNNGFEIKTRDEAASQQRAILLSDEAPEPMLRPNLAVSYLGTPPAPPAAPVVSSVDYPADGQPHGGAGRAGAFTLTPGNGVGIAKYTYQLDSDTNPTEVAGTGPVTVNLTPAASGTRTLTVRAFTATGVSSPAAVYTFSVAEPPRHRKTKADFNGDGKDDVVDFVRGSAGTVYVSLSDGRRFVQDGVKWHDYFGINDEIPLTGDFTGDGKSDVVTFLRGSSGTVIVSPSDGTKFAAAAGVWQNRFATGTEIPLVGDFDGDGRDDIASFARDTDGAVYVALSDGAKFAPTPVKWQASFAHGTEMPAVGDVNGDDKDDIVYFTGGESADVFVALSDGTRFAATPVKWHDAFAPDAAKAAVGDLDGDGKDDILSFGNGQVTAATSTGSAFGTARQWHAAFAGVGELTGVGDFTGDGKFDIATYTRGTDGKVLVAASDGARFGTAAQWHGHFALSTEVPRPSLFAAGAGTPAPVPPAAPPVSSVDYPADGQPHGAPGRPGAFVFRPGDAVGIAKYTYQFDKDPLPTEVPATGQLTVNLAPTAPGTRTLTVRSATPGGLASPPTVYTFVVAAPAQAPAAPQVVSTDYPADGQPHGLPGQEGVFTIKPVGAVPVTGFRWQLDDGTATDVAGSGEVQVRVTPTTPGQHTLTARALGTESTISAPTAYAFVVADPPNGPGAPQVLSLDYPAGGAPHGGPGKEGAFTFRPTGSVAVAGYRWQLNGGPTTDVAGSGKVLVKITPTRAGPQTLAVRTYTAAGLVSSPTNYVFEVAGGQGPDAPQVSSVDYPADGQAHGNAGQEGAFTLRPNGSTAVSGFRWKLDEGTTTDVPGSGETVVRITPPTGGTHTLTVWALGLGGDASAPVTYTFLVAGPTPTPSTPLVSAVDYPADGQPHGSLGQAGTFTLRTQGSVAADVFRYQLDTDAAPAEAPAGTGTAAITLTPVRSGQRTLTVWAKTAAGVLSAPAKYTFVVGAPAGPRDYFYDAAGQLVGVTNNSGEAAAYRYDAAGNLEATDRYRTDTASIFALVPARGPVGGTVEIGGTGFAGTPAGNAVTFDGVAAQVTAASANRLTVVVPAGTGPGAVKVVAGGKTATSRVPFVVTQGTPAPTFGSVSTDRADPGDTVTITGTGFDTDPTHNVVLFHQTVARVLRAGPTSLTVEVPAGSASGRVSVRTAGGTATSPSDFLVAPRGFRIDKLVYGGHLQLGQPLDLTIPAGKDAVVLVDGKAGERVHLDLENNTVPVRSAMWMFTPHGGDFARRTMGDPLDLWAGSTLRQDIPVFGANGTYAIVVAPDDDAAGSVRVTASHNLTGDKLTRDGAGVPFTVSVAEQRAEMTFTATQGEWLSFGLTDLSMPGHTFDVKVTSPDGRSTHTWKASLNLYIPTMVFRAEQTGTFTVGVTFGPGQLGAGKVWLSGVIDAGRVTVDGPGVPVKVNRPGQSLKVAFTGVKGKSLRYALTDNTLRENGRPGRLGGILSEPDEKQVELRSRTVDITTVPVVKDGEHNLFLTGWEAVGSARIWLTAPTQRGLVGVNSQTRVTVDRPGRDIWFDYDGVAGRPLKVTGFDRSLPGSVSLRLFRPSNGTQFALGLDGKLDVPALPDTGRYRIQVDPTYATTGEVTVAVTEPVDLGTVQPDAPVANVPVRITGQTVVGRFTGQVGQRLTLGVTTSESIGFVKIKVLKPDGSTLDTQVTLQSPAGHDMSPLPVAGTYTFTIEPIDGSSLPATGDVNIALSTEADGGLLTLGAPARAVAIGRVGQNAKYTFAGATNDVVQLAVTSDFPNNYGMYYSLVAPSGTISPRRLFVSSSSFRLAPLTETGTYTLVFDPAAASVGSITAAISRPAAAAAAGQRFEEPKPVTPHCLPGDPPQPRLKPARAQGDTAPETEPAPEPPATTCPWQPDDANLDGADWSTRYDPAPTRDRPLEFDLGFTALIGKIESTGGQPLAGVPVSVGEHRALTDDKGAFALPGLPDGHVVVRVDGTVNALGRRFGAFDLGVDLKAGKALVLPYTVFLPEIDPASAVRIPSPTADETVLTTKAIPGLEVRLPAGTVVRDGAGNVATELSLTPIPIDRPPFPLPPTKVPVYFTVQPGGSYLFPEGARIIYPNYTKEAPGTRTEFWNYDPDGQGWHIYGHGTVSADGRQIVPDPSVRFYRLTGAMTAVPGMNPPRLAPRPNGARVGDPVDPSTGLLVDETTDLVVDDIAPIEIKRTYQQGDPDVRAFGVGTSLNYGQYPWSPGVIGQFTFQEFDLVQPDGSRIHYRRTSPGEDYASAVFKADPTPTKYDGSIVRWIDSGWDVTLRDGTVMVIGEEAPLQEIRDKFGNTTTITRAIAPPGTDGKVRANGPITQITSPSGRWVRFTYDQANPPRVTSVEDNIGRRVSYTYDPTGHLETVTDVRGGLTRYTWENGRLKTITDPRNTRYLLNEYDEKGRIKTQTAADNGVTRFDYTESGDNIVETRITDPLNHVRRFTFNAQGQVLTDTRAFGTALAAQTVNEYEPNGVRLTSTTDPLGRKTTFAYDANGQVSQLTVLAGTPAQRTEKFERAGPHAELTKYTDNYNKETRYTLDTRGAVRSVTDGANRTVTYEVGDNGLVTKVTDPANKFTTTDYAGVDPIRSTDQLGRVGRAWFDAIGRQVGTADPRGATSEASYDAADQVVSTSDPLGRTMRYAFDPNGNQVRVVDARGSETGYEYDTMDRLARVTDPLGRSDRAEYDLAGNLARQTSRRDVITEYTHDELDRTTQIRYGAESTVAHTYDPGNRLRRTDDSASGVVTADYDGLDRVTAETTPHGGVTYAYDTAGRDRTVTVAGQAPVRQVYDGVGALSEVQQGGSTITTISRDAVGRALRVGAPTGGISQTYAYDDAGQARSITYRSGTNVLGELGYTYDGAGRPTRVDGSYARAMLPEQFGPATYDAANRIVGVGGRAAAHDPDGNLVTDGVAAYTWNARGQLSGLTAPGVTASFSYAADGRRQGRTVNGVTTNFLYDGLNPVQEKVNGAVSANLTAAGLDGFHTRESGGAARRFLTDAQGSVIGLVDSSGAGAAYTYEPFGRTYVAGADGGNPYRYTGREDDGTGLYHYRARYYSPALQRFISEDPAGFEGGTNWYGYTGNEPVTQTDPMGLKPASSNNSNSCGPNSFAADTPVRMADGSDRAIALIRPGDQVLATDPDTGRTATQTVTATIVGDGQKRLTEITVDTDGDGHGDSTITATDGHPFWTGNPGEWRDAGELRSGDLLRTSAGTYVQVTAVAKRIAALRVHNLSVDGPHTYLVVAGKQPVLVHNTNTPIPGVCGPNNEPIYDIPVGSMGGPTAYNSIPKSTLKTYNIGAQANSTTPSPMCSYCRANTAQAVDHVYPRSKGGNLEDANLTPACTYCNSSKRDRDAPKTPPGNFSGQFPPAWWPPNMQATVANPRVYP